MKNLIFVFLLISSTAYADVYKCVKDGRSSYQSQPCDQSSNPTKIETGRSASLAGCYEDALPELVRWTNIGKFEIKQVANGNFEWFISNNKPAAPMQPVTSEELQTAAKEIQRLFDAESIFALNREHADWAERLQPVLHANIQGGIRSISERDENGRDKFFLGLYRLKDKKANEIFVFYGPNFGGWVVKKIPCADVWTSKH